MTSVVPCTIWVTAEGATPVLPSSVLSPSRTAREGSWGVVSALWTANEPVTLSISRKSVNVPPMSMPIRTSESAVCNSAHACLILISSSVNRPVRLPQPERQSFDVATPENMARFGHRSIESIWETGLDVAAIRTGAAYFGNRTLRHVRADLQDMADSGFDYVVHCFTESDLIYGIETMREIVRMTHELGMEAHMDPWGVAGIFGGEAFSKFVAWEMDACQILADGSAVGIACLYSERLRAFCIAGSTPRSRSVPTSCSGTSRTGSRATSGSTARSVVTMRCAGVAGAIAASERFSAEYGQEMPLEFTDEVIAFRQAAVLDILTDVTNYASNRGVRQTLCLLPHGQYHKLVDLPDWRPFVAIPGIDTFGTDPYWAVNPPVELEPYVSRGAREVAELCDEFGLENQFWIQGYNFAAGHEWEPVRAIQIALEHGMTDLAVWSYRGMRADVVPLAGRHRQDLETIVTAFNQAKAGEPVRLELTERYQAGSIRPQAKIALIGSEYALKRSSKRVRDGGSRMMMQRRNGSESRSPNGTCQVGRSGRLTVNRGRISANRPV